jgi:AhpD family alkylhydroperoxidase
LTISKSPVVFPKQKLTKLHFRDIDFKRISRTLLVQNLFIYWIQKSLIMKDYQKDYHRLMRLMKELEHDMPETMSGYHKMQRNHSMDGALSAKTKEMIALGISLVSKSEACINDHLHHVLETGATRNEIVEVLSVAVMMGGGPVLIYAAQVLEALDQMQEVKHPARLYEHA